MEVTSLIGGHFIKKRGGDSFSFLIAFPSSYLVERGFSAVTNLITKKRERLQITNREDLRMLVTKIEPNINELLAKHQPHPSH
ncbi:unnamed protein product [Macrosiphum euphorbiae]|uniref:SCAN domain-containing protein 3 n=1 Tax=Macrosiphum euphorbiae TaxID=13131 RepID=A0AAV0VUK6_9HEMI|nr:unnamed protein product [Macrosiphum euphorbiae]